MQLPQTQLPFATGEHVHKLSDNATSLCRAVQHYCTCFTYKIVYDRYVMLVEGCMMDPRQFSLEAACFARASLRPVTAHESTPVVVHHCREHQELTCISARSKPSWRDLDRASGATAATQPSCRAACRARGSFSSKTPFTWGSVRAIASSLARSLNSASGITTCNASCFLHLLAA